MIGTDRKQENAWGWILKVMVGGIEYKVKSGKLMNVGASFCDSQLRLLAGTLGAGPNIQLR